MRHFLKDLRFMIRDAWASRGRRGRADHTLARTLREASFNSRGGALGVYGSQDLQNHTVDATAKSLDREGRR